MDKLKVYFDGSCDNSKPDNVMGIGVAVFWNNIELEEYAVSTLIGKNGTSNVAEWKACIMGLAVLNKVVEKERVTTSKAQIFIFGDSKLVVNQANGVYQCNNKRLKPYKEAYDEYLVRYMLEIPFQIRWIPRERNQRADELSKVRNLLSLQG